MAHLEFDYTLENLRNDTPDFIKYKVEKKDHFFSLGLGVTSRCNFNCPMCYYHGEAAINKTDMPLPLLRELLASLPILANIFIGLEGEPFCHPQIFNILDLAQRHGEYINFVSNGSLVNKHVAKNLLNYPVGSFSLSIDAAESDSYRLFRKGGDFTTFLNNARTLVDYLGTKVLFHTTLFTENRLSVVSMPEIASKTGIQIISLQQYRPTRYSLLRNIHPLTETQLVTVIDKLAESAVKNHIKLIFDAYFGNKAFMDYLNKLSKRNASIYVNANKATGCQKINNFTSITANGNIFPCCGDFTPSVIKEKSFDGIFNHEYLQRLRWLHTKIKKIIAPCQTCLHRTAISG